VSRSHRICRLTELERITPDGGVVTFKVEIDFEFWPGTFSYTDPDEPCDVELIEARVWLGNCRTRPLSEDETAAFAQWWACSGADSCIDYAVDTVDG
jgi:hypothetical protein